MEIDHGMNTTGHGDAPVPVVLTTYARPWHLAQVLEALRVDGVPSIIAYSDGPKDAADAAVVGQVRSMLRGVDWCSIEIVERVKNFGLGTNVRDALTATLSRHRACIVIEDDLVIVPGTYAWLCAALRHYADDPRVMSVTAWTHPRVVPTRDSAEPYFDGRAECWVWGTWARAWLGMETGDARSKLAAARSRGIAPDAYGADLPVQARHEHTRNIWAVRWLYHHMERGGLCLRPPWSMVEHIGSDAAATNAAETHEWSNMPLRPAPPIPSAWPEPREAPGIGAIWRAATLASRGERRWRSWVKRVVPANLRARVRASIGWQWFRGSYRNWDEASRAAVGYSSEEIVARILRATQDVIAGRAAYERDGMLFAVPEPDSALLAALKCVPPVAQGRLRVLDFGGSLGSTFWRHRAWIESMREVRWDIVEQSGFVDAGRQHLGSSPLRFFPSVSEACSVQEYDVLLASGVVQYLPDPDAMIEDWIGRGFPWLLLNNLPLHAHVDRISVQHVPPSIYPATYPVRFFNRDRFLKRFERHYVVEREFASEAIWPLRWRRFASTGLLLRRIS